ncbi:hypothetical protein BD408DRAFT_111720 [Parasitella parasitica]|nr:hypothetical protein BD408DRAFT_111720 [Parasitella parasitica]
MIHTVMGMVTMDIMFTITRYYRRYYPQYNSYYTPQPYAQPNYYGYQQQLIPNMTAGYASSPYAATYGSYGMPGYSYNSPIYSSMYNSAPVYGQTYNNGYYPANYLQRTYL